MSPLEDAITAAIKFLRENDRPQLGPTTVFLRRSEEHLRPYFGPDIDVRSVPPFPKTHKEL